MTRTDFEIDGDEDSAFTDAEPAHPRASKGRRRGEVDLDDALDERSGDDDGVCADQELQTSPSIVHDG
jgi:hypothetical protein